MIDHKDTPTWPPENPASAPCRSRLPVVLAREAAANHKVFASMRETTKLCEGLVLRRISIPFGPAEGPEQVFR